MTTRTTPILLLCFLSGSVFAVTACGSDTSPTAQPDAAHFVELLGVQGAGDVFGANSVEQLTAQADAVVVGTFTELRPGRVVVVDGDTAEDPTLQMLEATLEVQELIFGELPAEHQKQLVIELPKPELTSFEELSATLPSSRGFHFLFNGAKLGERVGRNPSRADARIYVHINVDSMILEDPKRDDALVLFTDELAEYFPPVASFDEVVVVARAAAANVTT
jgi:hypothetical protein